MTSQSPSTEVERIAKSLTRGMKEFFRLSALSKTGNPWPLIGVRQRAGGALARCFAKLQGMGLFDEANEPTSLGLAVRDALLAKDRP